ncbi:hypothetical protein B0A49_06741 [Cryomyces minteri]|uniref:Uncharacterized protein n=1 Tax=Cryomyces minteri TaxID=331657 RepID=A0A4U0WWL4_9PEZI|nr:hypothetical protein B0A49_06741 [Cryomyces minteri]
MDSPIVKATLQSAVLSATSNVLAQIFTAYREHKPFSLDPTPILQFVLFSLLTCPPNFLWQQWLEDSFPGYTHASEPGTTKSIAERPAIKDINEKAHAVYETASEKTSAAVNAAADHPAIKSVAGSATDTVNTIADKASQYGGTLYDLKRRRTTAIEKPGTVYEDSVSSHPQNGFSERVQTFSAANGAPVKRAIVTAPNGVEIEKESSRTKPKEQKKLNVRNTATKFALDQTVGAVVNTLLFIIGIGALRGNNGSQIMAAIRTDTLPLQLAGLKLWPLVSLISFTVIPVESRTVFGSIIGVGWGVFLSLMAAGGT